MSVEYLKKYLPQVYERNTFVRLLDMNIIHMSEGEACISMPVTGEKHTNLYGVLHGGALASLADTAMGVSCATLGNRVVTVEMNLNFIKSAGEGRAVIASAKVLHAGRQTMVAECEMNDDTGALIGKSRGTFMIVGKFDGDEAV